MERSIEENRRTLATTMGGILLGETLGGFFGAVLGGIFGAIVGESRNKEIRSKNLK